MKQILLLFVLAAAEAGAQPSAPFTKEQLHKKSNGQLITGIVFSAAGTGLMVAGISQAATYTATQIGNAIIVPFGAEAEPAGNDGTILLIAGLVTSAASIPFYVAARRNSSAAKKMKAGLQWQKGEQLGVSGRVRVVNYPSFQIVYRL